MRNVPTSANESNLSKKEFWVAAYLAALHRVGPEDALKEADKALGICDERWRDPDYVGHWKFKHDFPLGWDFEPLTKA